MLNASQDLELTGVAMTIFSAEFGLFGFSSLESAQSSSGYLQTYLMMNKVVDVIANVTKTGLFFVKLLSYLMLSPKHVYSLI